jgi:hypothetical protein
LASNRYRANRNLGNKINNIDGRLSSSEKSTSDPHLSSDVINSDHIAPGGILADSLGGASVLPDIVERGSIGSEHLGVVNQIASDGNLVLTTGEEGLIYLDGDLYTPPEPGLIYILAMDEENSVIPAGGFDIIPLDDLHFEFNGVFNRYIVKSGGNQIALTNPFRLFVSINGIMQSVYTPEYVWMSGIPRDGLFLDNEGYMNFSEAPPVGATFDGRIVAGPENTYRTTNYPFRAIDILLGA